MHLPTLKKQILFQHLPKTAGVSLLQSVESQFYIQNWAAAIVYKLKQSLSYSVDDEWVGHVVYQYLLDNPKQLKVFSDDILAEQAAANPSPGNAHLYGLELIDHAWFTDPCGQDRHLSQSRPWPFTLQLEWTDELYRNVGLPRTLGSLDEAAKGKELSFIISSHHFLRDHADRVPAFFYDNVFKFCVSRNPYDRFVSAYYYLVNRSIPYSQSPLEPGAERDPFIKSNQKEKHILMDNYKNDIKYFIHNCPNYCEAGFHFMPQVLFFLNADGKTLLMDKILKYENLEEDWGDLCRETLLIKPDLPRVNVTTERPQWEKLLDEQDRQKLAHFYWQDFQELNYKK